MSRPQIDDGLDVFYDWLRDTQMVTNATARGYVSHARKVVNFLQERSKDPEALDYFFNELNYEAPSEAATRRAWKLFRQWARDEKGVELPEPRVRSRRKEQTFLPLPLEVCKALQMLREVMHCADIESVRWAHVDTSGVHAYIRVPHRRGPAWQVSREAIDILHKYAQPGVDPSIPLVPLEPGSRNPYPRYELRKQADRSAVPKQVESPAQVPEKVEGIVLKEDAKPITTTVPKASETKFEYKSAWLPKAEDAPEEFLALLKKSNRKEGE